VVLFVVPSIVPIVAAAAYVAVVPPIRASVPPIDGHSHDVRTGDVITRYRAWGKQGPPLVLVPGFVESSFVWRRVGPLLGRSFRVYAPDVRGFGYTTHRGPYTLAADTAQLTAFLRALHLDFGGDPPVLVGHSSGAAIVANLALEHPNLVAGIVMLDGDGTSSGAGPGWLHALIVDPLFTAAYRFALHHPSIMRSIWDRVCGPGCPPFAGQEMQGWVQPLEVPGAAAAMRSIVQAPLIGLPEASLRRLQVPVAVMLGAGDPTITRARAREVARWVHARALVTVSQTRHLPMVSRPALFSQDLTAVVHRLAS
jgi:pimeloyl-ACP methyl ester carboxylesterase